MKFLSFFKYSTTAFLILCLSACGPATYDSEKAEESLQAIVEDMNADEKKSFNQAFQKVMLNQLSQESNPLSALATLANNPEKVKEYTACMNGKSAEEIIAMANRIESSAKQQNAAVQSSTAKPKSFIEWAEQTEKDMANFEKKLDSAAAELKRELDNAEAAFNKELSNFEKKLDKAAAELERELDTDDEDSDSEIDKEIDRAFEKAERELDRIEKEMDEALDELDEDSDDF